MRNPARSGSSPPARSRAAGATTARAASARSAARAGGLPLRRAFEVAGFRFSAAPGTAGFPLPAAYRDFAAARYRGPGLTRVGLGVCVRPGLRAPADPIFRADAWSIARSREGLLVTLCPPALRGRALAAARLRLRPLRVDAAVSRAGLPPFSYPVDQVLFMHLLASRRGAILHAAGFGFRGAGLAFPGCSGAGKTTLARLLRREPGWTPLSDDRVVVRRIGSGSVLFGSPWPGEGAIAANRSFPLAALVFLRHGKRSALERLTAREGLRRLLPVTSVPWYDPAAVPALLGLCGEIAGTVPSWELTFPRDRPVGAVLAPLAGARGNRPSPARRG